jgi:hypothetical protein
LSIPPCRTWSFLIMRPRTKDCPGHSSSIRSATPWTCCWVGNSIFIRHLLPCMNTRPARYLSDCNYSMSATPHSSACSRISIITLFLRFSLLLYELKESPSAAEAS